MKYCRNCGAELSDSGSFCPKCGTPIADNVQASQPQIQPQQQQQNQGYYGAPPVYQKTNTMSIVGFVTSLLGFSVISLILSIIGLSQVKKSQMTQMPEGGKGLAIAGIIISSLTTVAYIIMIIAYIAAWSAYGYYY